MNVINRYWEESFSPSYGTCYTFNSGRNSRTVRKASLTGVNNGLSIEMFIDQANYMINKLSTQSGMRLVLHNPKTTPLPEEEGLDLAPNTASSVAVRMVICGSWLKSCLILFSTSGWGHQTAASLPLQLCKGLERQRIQVSQRGQSNLHPICKYAN